MELILAFLSIFFLGHTTYTTNVESSELSVKYSSTPQEGSYHSDSSQKNLPYYFIEPENQPKGIFIYMHGAGGGYEQGMSDELFSGNFKNLKQILKNNEFLYVTPETSDFEVAGGKELLYLILKLRREYGELPVYLSGASAGGRTIFYAWQEIEKQESTMGRYSSLLEGIIFICPALSEKNIETIDETFKPVSVWIEAGEKDSIFPPARADLLLSELKNLAQSIPLQISSLPPLSPELLDITSNKLKNIHLHVIPEGDHSAPVSEIDWEKVLNFIK